jgi:hypothetical protein|tara:strand:+ start:3342 stop:5243 length:1902 start_codon:yes stop_codon:yes gene_type:complete
MYGIYDDIFWWQAKKDPHAAVDKYIQVLRDDQSDFYNDLNMFVGLYGGRPIGDQEDALRFRNKRPRLTFNIVRSLCQAATAKIAKHRPAISFLTSGGNWSQKRKAKGLDKFIQGQIYSTKAYAVAQKAFLDACIVGTGVIKVFMEHGKVKLERVRMSEITVDSMEAETDDPRQMFQTKKVSRHVLIEKFPKLKPKILEAVEENQDSEGDTSYSDMVECHEAWHLPSGPEAKDGRHVVSISTATLLDEDYNKDYFPFVFVRWTESPMSFWGNGLAWEVKGIQVEVNKLLAQIQEQMHLATPKVFIEETSKIVNAHLNNRVWGAIKYRGTPPQFFVPRPVSGEMFQHLDRLVNQAYEMTGISQLSAQSKKPTGLDSGRALREFSDIESERFMVVGQAYEETFVEISRQIISLVRDAIEDGESYSSMSFSPNSGVEHIKWKDVDMEEDQYVMRVQPVGSLPQTPAAKLASVTEMHMNGLFTSEEAHQLLDFPDLERRTKLKNSPQDLIDKIIDEMIENNKYIPPEPYFNLVLGVERVQEAVNLGRIENVPEERLEKLRRWITQAVRMMKVANKPDLPPPGEMMAPMGPPGMPPGPPPPGPPGLPPGLPPGPEILPAPPGGGAGPLPPMGPPGGGLA